MQQYDDCIIFLLAKAYQKAHGNFKKRLMNFGLTPIQHLIIEVLCIEDGLSAGDVGKLLTLDGATLSGVLDRLAESGWIVKDRDPDDKRVLRVYLADKAKEHRQALVEQRKEANEEIMSGFTLEERVLLKRLLRDVRG